MRAFSLLVATSCLLAPSVSGAQAKAKKTTSLPLKRVRLYETGIGYFERTGSMGAGAKDKGALPVPAGHLDDALKTLVVLSKDGKAGVDGIEFSSSVSRHMGLALAGLPAEESGKKIDFEHLLKTLKGAQVELRHKKTSFKGRLIGVQDPPASGNETCTETKAASGKTTKVCTSSQQRSAMLLTNKNEIRRFALGEITSLRPTDPAWRTRLGSALDALSQRGAQTSRKLRILGKPGKAVTVGYVAETPVWRSTYRLVLSKTKKDADVIQGWALLHNDTDESWKQVRVELVNGRPDSFLFPLAAPRYARRQLVTPQVELSTVPQLLDTTVDNMWLGDSFGAGGLGLSGVGSGGGGHGEGIGLGSMGTIGHGSGSGSGEWQSGLLAVGNLASLASADGEESGAMFRYKLKRPIDLRAHGSALLPFASEKLRVQRIAFVASPGKTARTGVHFTNTTRQTFPAGPISVFAGGGFAGETALTRTKPSEKRILKFGFDLDVELNQTGHHTRDEPRTLRYHKGTMTEHFVRHHTVTYDLVNRSSRARTVYMPLRYVSNADVSGADKLTYDEEQSQPIAVFASPAAKRDRRTLQVREGLSRRIPVKGKKALERMRKLSKTSSVPAAQRATLRRVVKHRDNVNGLVKAIARTKKHILEAGSDLRRQRANVSALRGRDAGEAIVAKMVASEQRVSELRKRERNLGRQLNSEKQDALKALKALNNNPKKTKKRASR